MPIESDEKNGEEAVAVEPKKEEAEEKEEETNDHAPIQAAVDGNVEQEEDDDVQILKVVPPVIEEPDSDVEFVGEVKVERGFPKKKDDPNAIIFLGVFPGQPRPDQAM